MTLSPLFDDGQPCVSFVTSGDIDEFLFPTFCWGRKLDGSFRNPVYVYVVLNKKNGQMDIYNISVFLEALERVFDDTDIGVKLAVGLSLDGNDYLPRFHNITHTAQLLTLFGNNKFRQGMFICIWEGQTCPQSESTRKSTKSTSRSCTVQYPSTRTNLNLMKSGSYLYKHQGPVVQN